MREAIATVQIVISVLLGVCILVQGRGAGLGSSFGGASEFYRSKRGVERLLFTATIVLIGLFFLSSLVNVLLS